MSSTVYLVTGASRGIGMSLLYFHTPANDHSYRPWDNFAAGRSPGCGRVCWRPGPLPNWRARCARQPLSRQSARPQGHLRGPEEQRRGRAGDQEARGTPRRCHR
ncbi:hypothetical protein BD626DRAFT_495240 [Schizophyllum amplum]|uniref:Uncharacterized protein n=1 Tax=Schizophyllum amplum TaxID=97359 RepID=A0A550CG07_9AGAR|nr:hypothetical protein BD626DRAFT_495240 [Auriculariopsis ampla]